MDRMIYLSMTGAKALMERQDALSHNLANASTDGFRADLMTARAVPIRSDGTATTRVFNVETSTGFDGKSGLNPVLHDLFLFVSMAFFRRR